MRKLSYFLIILLLTGCALYSDRYQGQRALVREEYDEAIALFRKALEGSPNDPGILADLGVAHFRKNDLQQAAQYLERAKSIDPTYGKPYPYMGMIYEKQGDLLKAIGEYSAYYQRFPLTDTGRTLRARIGVLMRKQITREIEEAIQLEKEIPVANIPENTIAVTYFANLTEDKEIDVLLKGLADLLVTDLSRVESLRVLERMRINVLMEEMALGASDLADSSQSPKLGKILGARRIINGGLAAPQEDIFRIDALAINIVTSWTDAHADVMDKRDQFLKMEKDLVLAILEGLDMELTPEELEAIQKEHTESFAAFVAYSLGLDYEDRGMYREAAEQFQKAIQIDPGFLQAEEKYQNALILFRMPMVGDVQELTQLEQTIAAAEQAGEKPGISSGDRLRSVGDNSTDGFMPDADATVSDERTRPEQQRTTTVNVIAEW